MTDRTQMLNSKRKVSTIVLLSIITILALLALGYTQTRQDALGNQISGEIIASSLTEPLSNLAGSTLTGGIAQFEAEPVETSSGSKLETGLPYPTVEPDSAVKDWRSF